MSVYKKLVNMNEPLAIALGFFDGVHLAHQTVIKNIQGEFKTAVLTFSIGDICPAKKFDLQLILTEKEKLSRLSELVDYIFTPKFEDIMDISPVDFVEKILLNTLHVKKISCGFDYTFGKNGAGNIVELKQICAKHNISLSIVDNLEIDGISISSTTIRNALRQGDILLANKLLGYPYYLVEEVLHGVQLGRKIGFPTINQRLGTLQVVLKRGVYETRTTVFGILYKSITNVGIKPTVTGNCDTLVETHILGFDKDIYGEHIKVEFVRFLRTEQKFENLEQLKYAIEADKAHII